MGNHFSKRMAAKSDFELEEILNNKEKYQKSALLAAAMELEQRQNIQDKTNVKPILEKPIEICQIEDNKNEIDNFKSEDKLEENLGFWKLQLKSISGLFFSKNYFVTPIIIYLNILIYVVMVLKGYGPVEFSIETLVNWGGNFRTATLMGEQWRLVTNIFLHGGIFHLIFNMYALLYLGKELEIQFGSWRYLFAYISVGIIASIVSISFNSNVVSVGASGAIFGMYGLFLVLLAMDQIILPKDMRKSIVTSILLFTGYNLFYGFTEEGIDNAAHIGGFLSGLSIGSFYALTSKKNLNSQVVTICISSVIIVISLILPKIIPNYSAEYDNVLKQFTLNEEKAYWIYEEDLTYIPPDRQQYYYHKLNDEGINLWKENIDLLNTLSDLPEHLNERKDLLIKFSVIKLESFQLMQNLVLFNQLSDQKELQDKNMELEKVINEIQNIDN